MLAVLRIAVGYVAVPIGLLDAVSVVVTVAFMALPIFALFVGAGHRWDLKQAITIVVLGVLVHVGSTELVKMAAGPAAAGVFRATGQLGLIVWCMGVGAGLACLLKDRNMLLPIAVFLALFDMWLVFAPEGLVSKAMSGGGAPISLEAAAYAIPMIATTNAPPEEAANGFAQDRAYIGPADFLFLAMFFVALYRFQMRPRQTLRAIVPVLIAYLAVVLLLPNAWIGPIRLAALPALLPIGLTVLWVNRREFKLLRDEKIITVGLLAIGLPLVIWRILVTQPGPEPPPEAQWSPPFEKTDRELMKPYNFAGEGSLDGKASGRQGNSPSAPKAP